VIYDARESMNNEPTPEERFLAGETLHEVLGLVPKETPLDDIMDVLHAWLSSHKLHKADDVDFVVEHMRPTIPHHIDDERVRDAIIHNCMQRQRQLYFHKSGEPRYFGPTEGMPEGLPRYELLEEIGRGAQSVVWKATDRKYDPSGNDILVALKIFSKEAVGAHRFVTQINHPNIAVMVDADEWQGRSYISFELIRGVPVSEWMTHYNPSDDEILSILIGITKGIIQVHNRGLIHRDLKPSNIMMSGNRPIIIDFGVAAQSIEERRMNAGSPLFMAPEQVDPTPDTAMVDIYAIAGIGYFLLTGKPPNGTNAEEADLFLKNKRRIDPSPLRRCKYASTILKCLAPHPVDRIQSAGELLNELECAQVGLPTIREYKRKPVHVRTRRPVLLAAELAVVLALSLLLFSNWKHTNKLEQTASEATMSLKATNQQTQMIIDQLMFAQGGDDASYWILKELAESPHEDVSKEAAIANYARSIPLIREEISVLERSPSGETLKLAQKHLAHARMMERHNSYWESYDGVSRPQYSSLEIRSAYSDAYDYLEISLDADADHSVLDQLGEVLASFPTD
jgi:serine/threonine protein kinase